MSECLQDRLVAFVRTLDGFEDIDALLRNTDPHGVKRADYLLANRTVIVELKTVVSDPQSPVTHPLSQRQADKLTAVMERDVSHADKQTAGTREIFGIPNAAGILVLLNEGAPILTPDFFRYRVPRLLKATAQDGSPRYPNNDIAVASQTTTRFALGKDDID